MDGRARRGRELTPCKAVTAAIRLNGAAWRSKSLKASQPGLDQADCRAFREGMLLSLEQGALIRGFSSMEFSKSVDVELRDDLICASISVGTGVLRILETPYISSKLTSLTRDSFQLRQAPLIAMTLNSVSQQVLSIQNCRGGIELLAADFERERR